ncbi:hypothetical protein ABEB36_011137 [Hypothenemus hampei]|uniref:Uncharacterized protein n=1 Tax=Hypothenemus hampei TaxID=57062 RepID=A0ABD1EEA7_HYPHA
MSVVSGKLIVLVSSLFYCLTTLTCAETSGKLSFEETTQDKDEKLKIPEGDNNGAIILSHPSETTSTFTCGASGCNATSTNNSVETQVLVHVKTKVNLDKNLENNKKVLDDVPDVPIVVGNKDVGSRIDETNRRYDENYGPGNVYYGNSGLKNTYQYYGQSNFHNGYQGNFYASTLRPLDYNSINTPVPGGPVTGYSRKNFNYNFPKNNINYRENGIEQQQIPYLEHTYNKNYFREEAPPQVIFIGRGNTHNPVEFRNIANGQWKTVYSNNKYPLDNNRNLIYPFPRNPSISSYNQQGSNGYGQMCSCRELPNGVPDNSISYSASTLYQQTVRPTKNRITKIDDKLAPLN